METKLTKLEHLTATMRAARAFIQGLVAQVAQAAADDIAAAQSVADTAHTTAQNAKSTADAAKNAADSAKAAAVVMKGATSSAAGAAGLTPAPAAGAQGKYLRGDGTWQTPPNTTYAAATQSSNGLLSAADKKKLDGVTAGANAYSLPAASASARGGVKIGYTANGKNYPVQLSNEQMYVNVPWTDTNTTYSNMGAATASAAGKAGLVPAPAAGAQAKYLRGDGTWQTPPDTNTTYTPASATPKAAGTAAVGKSAKYAREDHVHPAQTSVSGNAGTATKLATVNFTVGGDKAKYYPVLITTGGFAWNHINIYRGYGETAPTDWGTDASHRGGLTLCVRWSGDSGWGGNDHTVVVDEFSETYCKMVGGLALSNSGLIVWLRGGSAVYHISSENGGATAASVKLDTFTAAGGAAFAPRTYDAAVVANEVTARWKDRHGTYNGNVTGNAATATKLATARTINGVTFDGSANINVKGFAAQSTAPANTSLLWIDTTAKTGGLKYHNGSAWVPVPVAFT